ncbi:MAG: GTPase HflX, partial [Gammaproteobacteria bacterium]|nr:GTPase HflX [Gammaproteobacteria bacterium]
DIFAQRARSHEGKLQVELAQLKHLSTRLVRGWTHLERQKGGIGLRGPGETQLETDRRLLGGRIRVLTEKLQKVDQRRDQGRRHRRRNDVPTVSLVGYTNAGKSTLFNALTGAGTFEADQLFATLDPTVRRIDLPNRAPAVIADTVGFIRHLPHDLVASFRSTLQESKEADLLLHVVDCREEGRIERIETVDFVLQEIGAGDLPQVQVFNKCDLTGTQPRIERDEDGLPKRVWVSALSGDGLELLRDVIAEFFRREMVNGWVELDATQGGIRAKLFALGAVREERPSDDGGWRLQVEIPRREYQKLCRGRGMASIYP